jgi:hypothetical protein
VRVFDTVKMDSQDDQSTIEYPISSKFSRISAARSDYDSAAPPVSAGRGPQQTKRKEGKTRFFSQLKEWISTSEPSTQALKNHKKDTFRKAGIATSDPTANAKLHAPIGEIPQDAVKATTGPTPEERLREKSRQRRKIRQEHGNLKQGSRSSQSYSSHSGSSSLRDSAYFNFDKHDDMP